MARYLNGWLRLLRLPNLLTVPGDVMAGVAVMFWHTQTGQAPTVVQMGAACLASLLLYAGGLLDNDLVDQSRDAEERPERPLPSGIVAQSHVVIGLLVCFAGAMLLGYTLLPPMSLVVEVALLVAILAYNRLKQACPLTGGVLMGLCRGLNVFFGATILASGLLDPILLWPAVLAGCWTVYIFAVTLVSQRETTGRVGRGLAFLPAAILLTFVGVYGVIFGTTRVITTIACPLVLAFLLAAWSAYRIRRHGTPVVVQKSIGTLIRNLILLQAAACWTWDPCLTLALLALWPVHYLLGRWFYAS